MIELNKTIDKLRNRLDLYELPEEVDDAAQAARDLDSLLRARDLIEYYGGDVNSEGEAKELLIDFCEVYATGQFEDPDDIEGIVDWYLKVKDN